MNFSIYFWIDFKKLPEYSSAQREAMITLKSAYGEIDIMIPYPIRTLDFGIRGGEKLNEVMNSSSN